MIVEIEPSRVNRVLLSAGLSEQEVRHVGSEFSKNNFIIDDEGLLNLLIGFNKDTFVIISVFDRLGLGKNNAVRMIELRQKQKLGALVNIYELEVDDE